MVRAQNSETYKQFPAANSSCSVSMGTLQLNQDCCSPLLYPSSLDAANRGPPWHIPSDSLALSTNNRDAVDGASKLQSNGYNASVPSHNVGLQARQMDAALASEKRFLIFDRSGDRMRLFLSPLLSPQSKASPSMASAPADQPLLLSLKPPAHDEKWDENHLTDKESEEYASYENEEETDALFLSDNDEDEVTSTGHTEGSGFTGDDGSSKRRRLLDGKPLFRSYNSPGKEEDAESSNGAGIKLSKREKKDKIRRALKVLETILPCSNSKDPLSVIDAAILYLKSMKSEAESLKYA